MPEKGICIQEIETLFGDIKPTSDSYDRVKLPDGVM
jgi:hypothetical protein